jgi:excisionase family DNA binding protein
MKTYRLLDGTRIAPRGLSKSDLSFLATIERMGKDVVSYFEIYRFALGPGSPALRGGNQVSTELAESDLYKIAEDLATRAGIGQGLILAPEHEGKRKLALNIEAPLSVPQAAALIGISRIAAYKAIKEGRLGYTKIGNILIVSRAEAERYKKAREESSQTKRLPPRSRSAR